MPHSASMGPATTHVGRCGPSRTRVSMVRRGSRTHRQAPQLGVGAGQARGAPIERIGHPHVLRRDGARHSMGPSPPPQGGQGEGDGGARSTLRHPINTGGRPNTSPERGAPTEPPQPPESQDLRKWTTSRPAPLHDRDSRRGSSCSAHPTTGGTVGRSDERGRALLIDSTKNRTAPAPTAPGPVLFSELLPARCGVRTSPDDVFAGERR